MFICSLRLKCSLKWLFVCGEKFIRRPDRFILLFGINICGADEQLFGVNMERMSRIKDKRTFELIQSWSWSTDEDTQRIVK